MNIFRINTAAHEEEGFYIMTTLTPKQIAEVVTPIIESFRDGDEEYYNVNLIHVLKDRYPLEVIELRVDIETLTF
jgi:hypothetical protein